MLGSLMCSQEWFGRVVPQLETHVERNSVRIIRPNLYAKIIRHCASRYEICSSSFGIRLDMKLRMNCKNHIHGLTARITSRGH
jgi:hypothetical protein